ncbi:MAG: family 16 glycoside hydrolase [Nitrososphaera sp.]|jgi:hypothetical protein
MKKSYLILSVLLLVALVAPFGTPSTAINRAAAITQAADILLPNISITSPVAGVQLMGATLVVKGTANDSGSGVSRVEVRLNQSAYRLATPKSAGDWSTWSITFDLSTVELGAYKVLARVTDNAGNQNWSEVYVFYSLYDNFSSTYTLTPTYTSPNGKWYGVWNGAGSFGAAQYGGKNVFYENTSPVTTSSNSQSALTLSTQTFKNFELSLDVSTNKQTRLNSPPNNWEVAWIFWHYNDNTHFKYFLVKTDGSETGKYDGGVNPTDQKILYTSTSPKATIGGGMHWDIYVRGSHVVIQVNGVTVFNYYDSSTYNSGTIGLYAEDSQVTFSNVNILPL